MNILRKITNLIARQIECLEDHRYKPHKKNYPPPKICFSCGINNPPTNKHCLNCGAEL